MTIMSNTNTNAGILVGPFGDTTLTKVFVGGLAWETPKDTLRDHFQKYGHILEAVIINDKLTGRSKGYGFVTFKEPESAKKACEDPTPVINGRRANCNLASLGARRPRTLTITPPSPPPPPHQQNGPSNVIVGPRSAGLITPPPRHVQWYYPPTPTPATPYHHHHQTTMPYYGYVPTTYVPATDVSYNHKLGYTGGAYMSGGHYVMYPSQGAHTLMPMYPMYPYHHQTQAMGLPAQFLSAGPMTPAPTPTIYSKPTQIAPTPVCLAVE